MKGFTLLEMLLALSIAATALVVMMARLGHSADMLQGFESHLLGIETAMELLERERLISEKPEAKMGSISVQGIEMTWESKVKGTPFDLIKRHEYYVSREGEADVMLFLYRVEPAKP